MKDAIAALTGLCSSNIIPVLNMVKNEMIPQLTSLVSNKRAMTMEDIIDLSVWYVTKGVVYKIYYGAEEPHD